MRFILASQSPARLSTLQRAGLAPEVIVSGVDEDSITTTEPAGVAGELADLKATAVADRHPLDTDSDLVLGCDSVLELDGLAYGKPGTRAVATERWQAMRGRAGVLHTGHHLIRREPDGQRCSVSGTASTIVHFADVTDAEIEAYVATGEPLWVAGGFTTDGYGGGFITGIEGDHHNVVGVSLPLLRELVLQLEVAWPSLWQTPPTPTN